MAPTVSRWLPGGSTDSPLTLERTAIAALLVGAVIIAFAPILVRLSEVGPSQTGFYRFLLAIPLYWALAAVLPRPSGQRLVGRKVSKRDAMLMALAGAFIAADIAAWHLSIEMTTVANATLLANVAPVFVVLAGWLLFRIPVTSVFVSGLVVSMAGVFVLSQASLTLSNTHFAGDLLGVLTAVFYAAYQMTVQRLRLRHSTLTIMVYAIPVSAIVILPVAIMGSGDFFAVTMAGWAILLALAAGPQVLGQGLIAWALAHLPVAFASLSLLVQPVTAAAIAWVLFGEAIGPQQAIGGVAVLTGIMIARRGSLMR